MACRQGKEVSEAVENIKRRLCYTSTVPFRALDSIILSENPELHQQLHLIWESRSAEHEDGWQEQGRRDIMEEWLHPRAPQVQKKKQREMQRNAQEVLSRDVLPDALSGASSSWNTGNIFDALEESQYTAALQLEDLHQDELEEEEQGKSGKFVPSAVGNAKFEERAHIGKSGFSCLRRK
jgi:hypothetical protein